MGLMPVNFCFITGLKAENISSSIDIYEYKVNVNGIIYSLKFSIADWETTIVGDKKTALHAMLYNNDWPTFEDVLITPQFVDQLLRLSIYPRSPEDKLLYYLEKKYNQSNEEYGKIIFEEENYFESFSKNREKHYDVAYGLVSKGYIIFERPDKKDFDGEYFRITEDGRKAISEIKKKRLPTNFQNYFGQGDSPRIHICNEQRDKEGFKRISELIRDNGMGTSTHEFTNNSHAGSAVVRSQKQSIQKVDYTVFIISKNSVSNSIVTSTVALATEIHQNTHPNQVFLLFAMLDDDSFDGNPFLIDYHNQCFDARLRDPLNRMIQSIVIDWTDRKQRGKKNEDTSPETHLTKLKSSGNEFRNDVVLNEGPFDLYNNSYVFTIFPRTKFWRFGIRLSETQTIEFDLENTDRHSDKKFRDLHLSVGHPDTPRNWTHSNRIELAQYNFDNAEHITNRCDLYLELSPVQFQFNHDSEKRTLHVTYSSKECIKFETDLKLNGYRYFKIFAWADGIDFEIDFFGEIINIPTETIITPSGVTNGNTSYSFPTLTLTTKEKRWVEICYQKFKMLSEVKTDDLILEHWKEIGDFDPNDIDRRLLISGSHITLWGIWHVDPNSEIFDWFSKVMFAIKQFLFDSKKVQNVSTDNISPLIPEIDKRFLYQIFDLIDNLPNYTRGNSKNSENYMYSLSIDRDGSYKKFLKYDGLNNLMNELIGTDKRGIVKADNSDQENSGESRIKDDEIQSELSDLTFSKKNLPSYSSDKPCSTIPDLIGINGDVAALAAVITYKNTSLPLAIGLFGQWGSGKSTFMLHLRNRIDEISLFGKAKKNNVFCENIKHITFNAWHYSDANPWASIMVHLFKELRETLNGEGDELKKLQKDLSEKLRISQIVANESQIEKEAAEQKLLAAQHELADLKLKETQATRDLNTIRATDVIKVAFQDPEVQQLLEEIKDDPLITSASQNIGKLNDLYNELKFFSGRIVHLVTDFGKSSSKTKLIWCFFLLLPVFLFLLPYIIALPDINKWLINIVSFLGFVGVAASWALPKIKAMNNMLDRVSKAKERVDQVAQLERNKLSYDYQIKEDARVILQQKLRLVEEEEKQAKETIRKIEVELKEINIENRLEKFITSKHLADDYQKHLGLISLIHQDLNTLKNLLDPNEWNKGNGEKPPIERIVLYIDDLDRLNSKKVVSVLEAVHLLLALDGLFVVVAGVSSVWLQQALASIHSEQWNEETIDNNNDPLSYLEKIFQIPIKVRDLDVIGVNKMLNYHFIDIENERGNEIKKDEAVEHKLSKNEKIAPDILISVDEMAQTLIELKIKEVKEEIVEKPNLILVAEGKNSLAEKVKITKEEVEYMESLASLIGKSPRAVKRYINLYRILRTHDEVPLFTPQKFETFKAIMLLLAINVGYGKISSEIFFSIDNSDMESFGDWIENLNEHNGLDEKALFRSFSAACTENLILDVSIKELRKYTSLVSRYSFYEITA